MRKRTVYGIRASLFAASGQAGKQHRRNKQCDCLFHDGSLFVPDIVVRHDSII